MDFLCPACGAPQPSADSLCSGSFTDANHPANVLPIPATITLPTGGPVLDAGNAEHQWGPREVIQARSIIKRLIGVITSNIAMTPHELRAFERWLEDTHPPVEVYTKAFEDEARDGR